MTIALLVLSMVTSAIIGLPTISVAVPCGSCATLAWSRVTAITPVSARAGDAPAATMKAAASQRRDDIENPLLAMRSGVISRANDEERLNAPGASPALS